jgi:hypothetical protein
VLKRLLASFDPRLLEELKGQKRDIVLGIICSAISSFIGTAAIVAIVHQTVAAVQDVFLELHHGQGFRCLYDQQQND